MEQNAPHQHNVLVPDIPSRTHAETPQTTSSATTQHAHSPVSLPAPEETAILKDSEAADMDLDPASGKEATSKLSDERVVATPVSVGHTPEQDLKRTRQEPDEDEPPTKRALPFTEPQVEQQPSPTHLEQSASDLPAVPAQAEASATTTLSSKTEPSSSSSAAKLEIPPLTDVATAAVHVKPLATPLKTPKQESQSTEEVNSPVVSPKCLSNQAPPTPAISPRPRRPQAPASPMESSSNSKKSDEEEVLGCKGCKRLQQTLTWTQNDLMHENFKWNHFKKKAKRLQIWGALMGTEELPIANADRPCANTSSSSASNPETSAAIVERDNRIEELSRKLEESEFRHKCQEEVHTKLVASNEKLQKDLLLLHSRLPLMADENTVESEMYKAIYEAYNKERLVSQRLLQMVDHLKKELEMLQANADLNQSSLEEVERKCRTKLERQVLENANTLNQLQMKVQGHVRQNQLMKSNQLRDARSSDRLKEMMVTVTSLREEYKKARKALRGQGNDDMAKELDSIRQAYEELAEQNARLVKELADQDKEFHSLTNEKLKATQSLQMLKGEKVLHNKAAHKNEQLRQTYEQLIERIQSALATIQDEETRLSHENGSLKVKIGQQEREIVQLNLHLEEARNTSKAIDEMKNSLEVKASELVRQSSIDAKAKSQASEEIQILQKKLERALQKISQQKIDDASRPEEDADTLKREVAALRSVLNCNVCSVKRKDTIITRCLHMFCSECVNMNIKDRSRKCPQCLTKFSDSDVKRVFLTD